MNVQDIPEQGPPEVEQLVDALVDGKVAKYLLDTDTANELIKEIATESGLPRAAVRIVFKLLAPLLVRRGQAAAGWFGRRLVGANADLLVQLPGYSLIANKLLSIRAKFDTEVAGDSVGGLALEQHPPDQLGSTARRQSGILVDVHSALPWTLKRHNLSFLGQGRMDNLLKAHI